MANKKSVMLALSGGVDSSVCAHLLKESGYDVRAVVMRMSDAHDSTVEAAIMAADALSVPITVLDLRREFEELIIKPFISEYHSARTPSPCVMCNPLIKFKKLKETADLYGCEFYATGHYARVLNKNGRFFIERVDTKKDQSYMLYRLPQDILSRLVFPLCDYSKDAVRALAGELSLFCSQSPDSQENCFIENDDYAAFIEAHSHESKKGFFISPEGEKVAPHKGIIHYTVGQRKGLNIALGQPVFVNKIDSISGDVYLTYQGGQMRSEIEVENCVFMLKESLCEPTAAEVKIRSAHRAQPATLYPLSKDRVKVIFDSPASAPAPGQSAVFYIGNAVLGGGIIV